MCSECLDSRCLSRCSKKIRRPIKFAELARARAKRKIPQLTEALVGHRMTDHERFLIRSCLRHLACLEEELEDLDAEIVGMPPFQNAFALMQTLPGVGELSAAAILAETGTDVASFPTAEPMVSWAGLCPGNRESAGIRKGSQTTHGNKYLRTALVQCAWSASRKQGSVFETRFRLLIRRLGPKRAIVAVTHHMIIIYSMLRVGVPFRGAEGASHQRRRQRRAHHHLRCLRRLGVTVQVLSDDLSGQTR